MINKLLDALAERIKPMVAEAYRKGYADATTDVCRRLDEIYSFGFEIGKADALAEAGIVELDDVEKKAEG